MQGEKKFCNITRETWCVKVFLIWEEHPGIVIWQECQCCKIHCTPKNIIAKKYFGKEEEAFIRLCVAGC